MELLLVSLLNGLVYGLLLFMLSSGVTLIFGMMGVLNYAHASFYMLGAYFAYSISTAIGFWPALLVAPLIVGLLGALVERYGLRYVHRGGHVAELLFTFGLAFVLEEVVQLVWGKLPLRYAVPQALDFTAFTLFASNFPAYRLFMMLISVGMFLGLFLMLTRTRIGHVVQAALSHPQMVSMLGHNVPRVYMLVFGIGSALAGLAGVIGGNAFSTEPGMARALGAIVFVVVVIGGLGSLSGALIASLLIGFVQTFFVSVDWSFIKLFHWLGFTVTPDWPLFDLWRLTLTQIGPVFPFMLLIATLIFRPRGLFGTRDV